MIELKIDSTIRLSGNLTRAQRAECFNHQGYVKHVPGQNSFHTLTGDIFFDHIEDALFAMLAIGVESDERWKRIGNDVANLALAMLSAWPQLFTFDQRSVIRRAALFLSQ